METMDVIGIVFAVIAAFSLLLISILTSDPVKASLWCARHGYENSEQLLSLNKYYCYNTTYTFNDAGIKIPEKHFCEIPPKNQTECIPV